MLFAGEFSFQFGQEQKLARLLSLVRTEVTLAFYSGPID